MADMHDRKPTFVTASDKALIAALAEAIKEDSGRISKVTEVEVLHDALALLAEQYNISDADIAKGKRKVADRRRT